MVVETIIDFNQLIGAYAATIQLANHIIEKVKDSRERKNEEIQFIRKVIYNRRHLSIVTKHNYNGIELADCENVIIDKLKCVFGENSQLAEAYELDSKDIFFAFRYHSTIDRAMIDASLENFIKLAKKKYHHKI